MPFDLEVSNKKSANELHCVAKDIGGASEQIITYLGSFFLSAEGGARGGLRFV